MAERRVASWYWITTAALTPLALVSLLAWVYYTHQLQSGRIEGRQLVEKLQADRDEWDPLNARIDQVATYTGFGLVRPTTAPGSISQPTPFSTEKERGAPREKRSPLLQYYLDAEELFWGATAEEAGYLHDYVNARARLAAFRTEVEDYLAVKTYQHYTVTTISIDGEDAAVASGDLGRNVDLSESIPRLPQSEIDQARPRWDQGEAPADATLPGPGQVNLELIFRKQSQLIRDLVAANHHQYALLVAGVADELTVGDQRVRLGYLAEEARAQKVADETAAIRSDIEDMKRENLNALQGAGDFAGAARAETDAKGVSLGRMVVAAESRIESLQSSFESERTAHAEDAAKYDEMIRNLPRLKNLIELEKSGPDGEIVRSDYQRGIVHIDLGSADGVRIGQRFEVWRLHGQDPDEFIGVVEIVRTLNAHYSLCTVLNLTDDSEPIRNGDQIVSRLWHNRNFLTVALHGTFEPPNEAYSKERLTELLEQQGVRVVDRVQPGTDLVILGSRLLGDEWYRQARNDLRFETMSESDVRLYVDPR